MVKLTECGILKTAPRWRNLGCRKRNDFSKTPFDKTNIMQAKLGVDECETLQELWKKIDTVRNAHSR